MNECDDYWFVQSVMTFMFANLKGSTFNNMF